MCGQTELRIILACKNYCFHYFYKHSQCYVLSPLLGFHLLLHCLKYIFQVNYIPIHLFVKAHSMIAWHGVLCLRAARKWESVAGQYEEVVYFCLRAEFQFYFSVKIYRQVYFSLCLGYLHSVRI